MEEGLNGRTHMPDVGNLRDDVFLRMEPRQPLLPVASGALDPCEPTVATGDTAGQATRHGGCCNARRRAQRLAHQEMPQESPCPQIDPVKKSRGRRMLTVLHPERLRSGGGLKVAGGELPSLTREIPLAPIRESARSPAHNSPPAIAHLAQT